MDQRDCCCQGCNATSNRQCLRFVEDFGAVSEDSSPKSCRHNTNLLTNVLLRNASNTILCLAPHGSTIHFYHGVVASNLENSILILDGTLQLHRNFTEDPKTENLVDGEPAPMFYFQNGKNITITSSGSRKLATSPQGALASDRGLIHGNGPQWWGVPFVGYLQLVEWRPRLLVFNRTTDLLLENLVVQDAPFYHIQLQSVNRVEIRHLSVVSRRIPTTTKTAHSFLDLSAFNTDGIDVSGHNVHIHHCDIWTQDDCVAIKDNFSPYMGNVSDPSSVEYLSSNMTIEHITASGLGLVVGSIERSTVRNITFQHSYLYRTFKGIYFKFREAIEEHKKFPPGLIEDVTFHNITMDSPQQWPIWIGPAQQAVSRNPCHASPCSLCWPFVPMAECNIVEDSMYRNLKFSSITINNPVEATGVLMGGRDEDRPRIQGLVMENVRVTYNPPQVHDPFSIFPSLAFPVRDPYIRDSFHWLVGIGLGGCACLISYKVWRGRRKHSDYTRLHWSSPPTSNVGGEDDDGDTRGLMSQSTNVADALAPTVESIPQSRNGITKRGAHYCQFFLFTLLILGCTWYWFVQAQTHNVTKYYVCEGVVDGVALGDTWPVPFCLRDETTATNPTAEDGYYISSLSPTFVLVMIVLEGIAVAGSFSIIAALLPGANIERFNGEAVRDQDAVASIDIDDSRPHQQDDPLPDDEL